jgi:aspartyl-tRNA(Asn)/glutamyl-tRNA(Gln) amidotransferase subunit A
MTESLTHLTVSEARTALRGGETTAVELTEAYLERIRHHDGAVRAYLTVTADVARRQAAEADRRRAAGEDGPLLGIPYGLKDIFVTEGITTTAASRMLADYVPPESATAVRRLEAAGAVLLGKQNLDEFAMGSSTENSAYFTTRNPWDLSRVPGGSSGGSAAAVAADLCAFALGTDTGGSVRQPACLCGVVGFKPTYGRVSRYGMIAFASSLDQCSPITKSVVDAGTVLAVLAGEDPNDPTTDPREPPQAPAAPDPAMLAGLRIGVPEDLLEAGTDRAVMAAFEASLDALVGAGARRVSVRLPSSRYAVAAYYLIAPAEASSNLARYDGLRYGHAERRDALWDRIRATRDAFGPEVKRRIMLGTYALSSGSYDQYYGRATRVRQLIRADFEAALGACDVLVTPTTPEPAFRIGERSDDPLAMYLSDVFTVPASLAGLPALSVPCGEVRGLPIGLQMIGRAFEEAALLQAAAAFETVSPWPGGRPALSAEEERL